MSKITLAELMKNSWSYHKHKCTGTTLTEKDYDEIAKRVQGVDEDELNAALEEVFK